MLTKMIVLIHRPILISVEGDREYEVDLVLATLLDDSSDIPPSSRRPHHDTITSTAPVSTPSSTIASTSAARTTSSHTSRHHSVARAPPPRQSVITRREETQRHNEVDQDMDVSGECCNIPDVGDNSAVKESSTAHAPGHGSSSSGSGEPPFPTGSQFRRPISRAHHLADSKTRDSAREGFTRSSSDKSSVCAHVSPSQQRNVTQTLNTVHVSSQKYSASSMRSREEDTAGMVDSLFEDNVEAGFIGKDLMGTRYHDTELPHSSTVSRPLGALDRTAPASLSQFGMILWNGRL